jgi:hypothetical protein
VKVLSVDPGGTSKSTRREAQGKAGATGAVLFEPVSRFEIKILQWWEIVERMEFLDMAQQLHDNGVEYCICEYFYPADFNKTWQPDVVYIIGTLEYIWRPEYFYNKTRASDANQWGTDAKMNGYYAGGLGKGGEGHAKMAGKHALHWTANVWNGWKT